MINEEYDRKEDESVDSITIGKSIIDRLGELNPTGLFTTIHSNPLPPRDPSLYERYVSYRFGNSTGRSPQE